MREETLLDSLEGNLFRIGVRFFGHSCTSDLTHVADLLTSIFHCEVTFNIPSIDGSLSTGRLHFITFKMPQQICTVAVIGCGVIGASWASLFLSRGLKVIISDPAQGAKENFKRYLQDAWPALQASRASEHTSSENYEFVDDLAQALPDADFVQEVPSAVPDPITMPRERR